MVRVCFLIEEYTAWKTLCAVPQELVRPESCLYIWTRLGWWKWQVSTAIQLWFAGNLGKWEDWKWFGFWISNLGKASYSQDHATSKVEQNGQRVVSNPKQVSSNAVSETGLCSIQSSGSLGNVFPLYATRLKGCRILAESSGVSNKCEIPPRDFSSGSEYNA